MRTRRPSASNVVGWLVSSSIHLASLIFLGLLLAPQDIGQHARMLLELAVASPDEQSVELLALETSDETHETVVETELPIALDTFDSPGTISDNMAGVRIDWVPTAAGGLGQGCIDLLSTTDGRPGRAPNSGSRGYFFGTAAYGERFVYVLDMSTSMRQKCSGRYKRTRFEVAAEELVRSVDYLTEDQQFYVLLFCYRTKPMFESALPTPRMVPATEENKNRLKVWIENIQLGAGTDPRIALRTGLRLKPSAIFLLSDGDFNGREHGKNQARLPGNPTVEQVVAERRQDGIPIHTIAFEDLSNRKRLQALAETTGGTYRFVKGALDVDDMLRLLRGNNQADILDMLRRIRETIHEIRPSNRRRLARMVDRMVREADDDVRGLAHLTSLEIAAAENRSD